MTHSSSWSKKPLHGDDKDKESHETGGFFGVYMPKEEEMPRWSYCLALRKGNREQLTQDPLILSEHKSLNNQKQVTDIISS